jgi:hypothetical protein
MRSIEPGIHRAAEQVLKWIPGSRYARPGMTVQKPAPTYVQLHKYEASTLVRPPVGSALTTYNYALPAEFPVGTSIAS